MNSINNPGFNVKDSFLALHRSFMASGRGIITLYGSTLNSWRWYHYDHDMENLGRNKFTFVNTKLGVIAVYLENVDVLHLAMAEEGLPQFIAALQEMGAYVPNEETVVV